MKGTLINYFFHCKRQCYLHARNLTLEDNSDLVQIGKYYHEERIKQKNMCKQRTEIEIDNIKIDQIGDKYVTEFKKKDSDIEAVKLQLLYYLYVLEKHGIKRKGIIKFKESTKQYEVELNSQNRALLDTIIKDIENLLNQPTPPSAEKTKKCYKCAYYEYCFI